MIVENLQLTGERCGLLHTGKRFRGGGLRRGNHKNAHLVLSGSVSDRRYSPGNTDASINLHIGNIATVDYDDGLIKDNLNVEVKASYADENVGTGKPVTIDDVVLTGTHAENYDYELNFDNLTGNILKGLQSAPDVSYDNNGHITGTDSSMEYRYNGGSWETLQQ